MVDARRHNVPDRGPGLCLFCLSGDQRFSSEEHVLSEALGNDTLTLPIGVVCDRCNNGVLSRLDEKLLSFPPIQMMRVIRQLPSKAGQLPTAGFSNGKLVSHEGNQIVAQSDSVRFMQGSGPKSMRISAQMANLHGRQVEAVSRSMLKSALECAYIDRGYDEVISPGWDDVRAAVVDGRYPGYVAIVMQAVPGTDPLQIRYQPGSQARDGYRIWVELNVYGLRLFTALGHPLLTSFIPNALQVLAFPSGRYGGGLSLDLEFDYRERHTVPIDAEETPWSRAADD